MVAGVTGDAGWVTVAWILGAVVSLAGALCYAELATTYPHAGGDYHFLTRAWGRRASFLYAWARATVINTGSIALLAFVFGDYMAKVVPLGAAGGAFWAALIVVALTAVNIAGLKASSRTQNWLTIVRGRRPGRRGDCGLHGATRGGRRRGTGGVLVRAGARHVRAGDGVRAAHLRRLERSGLHLGGIEGRPSRDRAGAGDQPRDPRRHLPAGEPCAALRARASRASPTARPPAPT